MNEIWKDIIGYEGLYQVSNMGNVMSLSKLSKNKHGEFMLPNRIMKCSVDENGYKRVTLVKCGRVSIKLVHRLVALAFVPNPNRYYEVNHKDEDKLNSKADNLEWCTRKYNMNYGTVKTRISETTKGMRGKVILQLTQDGVIVGEWNSLTELNRNGFNGTTSVWKCCNGKQEMHRGFYWKYKF